VVLFVSSCDTTTESVPLLNSTTRYSKAVSIDYYIVYCLLFDRT